MKEARIAFVTLLLCTLCPAAETIAPVAPAPLRFRHWQRDEGLPQASATAIAQTPDGYLWVATYSGLARFDGRRFVTFDDPDNPLRDLGKTAMTVSHTGELLATSLQGGVYALRDDKFTAVGQFPGQAFERIAEDAAGDLWLVNEKRMLIRMRDRLEIPFDPKPTSGWSMTEMHYEADARRLWVLRNREFGYIADGKFTALVFPEGDEVRGFGPANGGGIWVVFPERLERWVAGECVETIVVPAWPEIVSVCAVTETSDHRIAVGTTTFGLFLYDRAGQRVHYDRSTGLADNWIMQLYVDREGSLWVGTATNGLNALQPVTFDTVVAPDNWGGRSLTNAQADPRGGFWVGTEGGGMYHWDGKAWEQHYIEHPAATSYVWTIGFDAAEHLWVGTWGAGVYERTATGYVAYPEIEAPYQAPAAFLLARDGSFWLGSEQGIFRRKDGQLASWSAEAGVPRARISCLAEGPDGALWFGTIGEGLGRLQDGRVKMFQRADGLSGEHVTALHFDDTGALWIGTEEVGLTRYQDGAFRRIGAADGLRARYITHILDDHRGSWWLSARDGVIRVGRHSLLARAAGGAGLLEIRSFTTDDGLPSIECSGSAALAEDGTIFFPTKGGLARTHPGNVITNRVPPPVHIESVTVDGRLEPVMAGRSLVVEPGSQRFAFAFTAPSFIAAQSAAFRYQLEGVDQEWVNAGPERTAIYSFLPPGQYVFRVQGANGHGIWSDRPAELTLTIQPFFWETWWFRPLGYVGAALGLGLVTLGLARRRWARERADLERRQALERERTRIAQDIHDDLGASLTRLSLLTQSAQRELSAAPGEVGQHLDQIGRTTREMTRTMDEIVWAVNPSHDSLDGIATYVAAYAQDFLGTAGISCRWNFPLTLPAWPVSAEVRHNLFLAVKEALANVVHHARATRVDLALVVTEHGFTLSVTDDGVGGVLFPSEPTRASGGGNGLRHMRRRLEEIGGHCLIESASDRGTSVRFTIRLHSSPADQTRALP